MGVYIGPFRFTKRGTRVRIGPRWLRLHLGAGRRGHSRRVPRYGLRNSAEGSAWARWVSVVSRWSPQVRCSPHTALGLRGL